MEASINSMLIAMWFAAALFLVVMLFCSFFKECKSKRNKM